MKDTVGVYPLHPMSSTQMFEFLLALIGCFSLYYMLKELLELRRVVKFNLRNKSLSVKVSTPLKCKRLVNGCDSVCKVPIGELHV